MGKLSATFSRSIGKKFLMAVSGLLLTGFLITHLAGNMLLLAGEAAFNRYAETLRNNPLLPLAEIVLAAIFLTHIVSGLRVTFENRRARPVGYQARRAAGGQTLASTLMPWTGLGLIVFLAVHLWSFRLADASEGMYRLVMNAFKNPLYAGFYLAAMLGMVLHVSHGFASAFQTLGMSHPRWTPHVQTLGRLLSIALLGFAALSVWAHFA